MLWGILTDPPLLAVLESLQQGRAPFILVDQSNYPDVELELGVSGRNVSGCLRVARQKIRLECIDAAFVRPQDLRTLPDMVECGRQGPAWQHALTVEDELLSWAEITPALVINRPSAMSSNASKPYQMEIIRSAGFKTPETLITTDPDAVQEFWRAHDQVVYKSISGVRSIVRRLADEHVTRIPDVANCPTQFQEYIPGNDYRVHVVAGEVFACEIMSHADDYRYASRQGYSVGITRRDLPQDVAMKCVALTRTCGLTLAGIDLRLTPEGEWYCFEVNPSPAFTYYQQATRERMDEAVARALLSGPRIDRRPL